MTTVTAELTSCFWEKTFRRIPVRRQLKEETAVHKEQLDALAKAIYGKYPNLDVETFLMSLDGEVEEIGHIKAGEKH